MIRTLPEPVRHFPELGKELNESATYYVTSHRESLIQGDPKKVFIRNRKLPLPLTVKGILARRGETQYADLMNFYDQSGTDPSEKATAEAFRQRRLLIKPEGLRQMSNHSVSSVFLKNEDLMNSHFGNLIIVAIDGSDIWVPRNTRTEQKYGVIKENPNYNDPCMAKLSGAYFPYDGLFSDVRINRYKYSERKLAMEHIIELENQFPGKNFLFIMDRGYYSAELMYFIYSREHYFIFRLPTETLKKHTRQIKPGEQKEIQIQFTRLETNDIREKRSLRNHILNTKFDLTISKPMKRPDDPVEEDDDGEDYYILLSNLPAAQSERENEMVPAADVEEHRVLYRNGRWPIETAYGRLKDDFKLEDYTSDTPQLIEQEIYASVYVYNLTSMVIKSAYLKYPIDQNRYKRPLMPNFNKGADQVKLNVLKAVSEPDIKASQKIWDEIYSEVARNSSYKKESAYGPRKKKPEIRGRSRKRGS